MYSTSPHQQLLQAIANLSDQEIPIVLQFISSLETQTTNYPTKPQTVLERMGGYPKFLLEGAGNLSDRDVRKKAIADKIQAAPAPANSSQNCLRYRSNVVTRSKYESSK